MENKRQRINRTGFFVCIILLFIVFFPAIIAAHAPSNVKVGYDQATETLNVTITHTKPSNNHYIDKVEIKKNGKPFNVIEYNDQTDETVNYSYKVVAVAGDTFEVKVYCNKFGSKTQKFTVPDISKTK